MGAVPRRSHRVGAGLLVLGGALVLLHCAPEAPEGGRAPGEGSEPPRETEPFLVLEGEEGERVRLTGPPERIISLVPSATETLLSLGAQERIVARTDHDTASALRSLPSVGGGLRPSLEWLAALNPDLVILFAGESDRSTSAGLARLDIPALSVRPEGIEDIRRIIRQLGAAVGNPEGADSLLAGMDRLLEEVRGRVQGQPPVRTAYLLGGHPPWVAGPGSYVHELLVLAGGENVFSDLDALYGPISPEEFLVRDIDLLLASEATESPVPYLAVPMRRVPSELEIPGPNLGRSALALARILHPEAFR